MDWIGFFLAGWGLLFTLYLVIQVLAIWHVRGPARVIISIPLALMVLVLIATFSGYSQGSNQWPILLILSSPLATIFVVIVWLLYKFREKRKNEE